MAQQISTLGQNEKDPAKFSFVIRELAQRISQFLSGAGTIDLPGGQVAFPAAQNASTDPNTLDDYEEGTWTPVLTFATPGDLAVTYSTQVGLYVKIGSFVFANFSFVTTAFSYTTASGEFRITGLPFTSAANGANGQRAAGLQWAGITKANYTDMIASVEPSLTYITIRASGSGQASATIQAADIPTGGTLQFRGALPYLASA